jgi:predicted GIY-YIG superfamily endonuclease
MEQMAKIKQKKKPRKSSPFQITYLYVLISINKSKFSYVGVTNNMARRIRQHNGEIVGGARYTSRHAPWRVFAMFQLKCRHDALSLEWKVKHRKNSSDGKGIEGRVHAVKRLGVGLSGFHQCV